MASDSLPFPPQTHYISNAPYSSDTSEFFYTVNPATNTNLARIPIATPRDLSAAVAAATAAFDSWSQTPPVERSRILLRAVAILRERNNEIAYVESLDTGKPFSETSTVDVATGADVLEYFAGVGMAAGEGKTIQLREEAWVYTRKEPLGVCVGIGAWNYPIQIALWKCAPALAAGNTFVFKPSEVTPLTANMLAEVFIKAGLPKGVFNVVHGGPSVGAWLTQCKDVAKVSFTGQPSTGSKVYASSAGSLKAITLELGGKSPFIVFPDADLSAAADLAMTANFYSTGQVCTNGTRVFVHSSVAKEFTSRMLSRIAEGGIRAGDPLSGNTNFGPVVSEAQFDKVRSYIKHGIETDGATLLTGGLDAASLGLPKELSDGFFIPPTIFTDCKDDMKIVREEIFGPVMCVLTFDDEDEVIRRANDTELGLAAGVMTRNLKTAHRVMAKVKAGICWINTWGESPAQMPVGGWGMSGVGVENGVEAMGQFLRNKSVLVEAGNVEAVFAKL